MLLACPTPLGQIWLWGDRARLETDMPVLVIIGGVFCKENAFWFRAQEKIPEVAVFAANLPGHFCPELSETSMDAFVRAFAHAIQRAFGGRPVVVCGESIGGAIALGLPNPGIGRLALDPPLRTGRLWTLQKAFAEIWADQQHVRGFLRNIFGFDGENFEDLDYTYLVRHEARVLIGGIPFMPPREFGRNMPSLVEDSERQLFREKPFIKATTIADAGHVMIWYEDLLVAIFREELDKAVSQWGAGKLIWKADSLLPGN